MTDSYSNPNCVFVAIDVIKRYNDVLISWPNGKRRFFKVSNSYEDHLVLIKFLNDQNTEVVAALEATADYHQHYRLCSCASRYS